MPNRNPFKSRICYPFLIAVPCIDPENGRVSHSNASLSDGGYPLWSEASFQCDNGYQLITKSASGKNTCQSDGTWDPPPVCTKCKKGSLIIYVQ